MTSYCDATDLYLYGLPRGALASPARLVASASATTDTFELDGHGFEDDQPVQFRAVGGGSLPTGVSASTTYYAIKSSEWEFQIAATAGGSAIDLTTAGTTFAVLSPLPIDETIESVSRMVDDMCPAHLVPFEAPIPDVVSMTTAELAAAKLLALSGGSSASLTTIYDAARKRLERWAKGIPIRGDNAPSTSQHAVGGSASYSTASSLPPWRRYGGIA